MTIAPGARLGPYEIVAPLGAGGMGEVYRAKDTRLGREVAIKVLPADLAGDRERRRRFEHEARAVSALSHPGIVTLFEIESATLAGRSEATDFLVMELVPGEPLQVRIPAGGMPVLEVLDLALQGAEALAAAHAAGVVHRDLKPANLMVTPSGRLKILDFGLARLHPVAHTDPDAPTLAASAVTLDGTILGTMGYLAPEQAAGERADARCDLFSFGVVLYQMLSGVSPFARDSPVRSLAAVLHEPAPPLERWREDVPTELRELVARCLEKEPARRPQSAEQVGAVLRELRARLGPKAARAGRLPGLAGGALAAAAVALVIVGAWWWRGADARWVENEARPQIERLLREERRFDAYVLGLEAERRTPRDESLQRLLETFTFEATVDSDPPGARVVVGDYREPRGVTLDLGTTPIARTRVPAGPQRFRVEKAGFAPIESAPIGDPRDEGGLEYRFRLTPEGELPPGMVRVDEGVSAFRVEQTVTVPAFWIDRLEVTNRAYQGFVDAGGYERRESWREPFREGARELSWEEAMARLRDATGRPGPATWELGRYPDGAADLPVGGVSWYEAMAYAAWAGKSLPTFHHWYRAANPDIFSEIIELSNFDGSGPRPVGSSGGLGPWGTLDMAGNVKEWTATASEGLRYQLGGGFGDAGYLYAEAERAAPLGREASFGFRCARYDAALGADVTAPVVRVARDFAREQPVDDAVFGALVGAFAYDRNAPLDVRDEGPEEERQDWRVERVSVAGAYGNERLPIRLYLPKRASPPYSAVLFFPDSTAESMGLSDRLEERYFEFLLRSGRAVVFPVFANTYERRQFGWTAQQKVRRRDLVIAWSKEVGRTLDYLETRSDFDPRRTAFYGFSLGAVYLPVFVALEPRFATGISLGGGLSANPVLPENDPLNFAPRVRIPILMVAGRDDFVRPVEILQRPLFDRLATAADRKRLAILDGGHVPARMNEIVREVLDWLDRWLGPVASA